MNRLLCLVLFTLIINCAYAQIQGTVSDTINFETDVNGIYIVNDSNNIWQIGKPSKTQFKSSFEGQNAIVTDTVNSYPANNYSSFIVPFYLFSGDPELTFWHKFHTQKNKDGGYIEYSLDSGLNWDILQNINDTVFYSDTNFRGYRVYSNDLYKTTDSLPNNKIGFSGDSKTWQKVSIKFWCLAVKKAMPLLLKFVFESDSIHSGHNGWIIDYFQLTNQNPCGTSVQENSIIEEALLFPNPFSSSVMLSSSQKEPCLNFKIFDLNGTKITDGLACQFPHLIETEEWNTGLYVFEFEDETGKINRVKMIKN